MYFFKEFQGCVGNLNENGRRQDGGTRIYKALNQETYNIEKERKLLTFFIGQKQVKKCKSVKNISLN